jgi:alpha-1,6-mannosyltransferase
MIGALLKKDLALLVGLGAILEASLVVLLLATRLDRTSTLLEPYFAIGFTIYVGTVIYVMRSKATDFYPTSLIIVGVSIVVYLTFAFQTPTLSGDIYRYIWDGKLINNGLSPYEYAPYASQLAYLRDSNWQLVQNKDIISPYPPLLEFLNALTYRFSPTVLAFKGGTILASLASIIMLPFFLKKLNLDPRLSIIFAWNPLFVLEFGSSGHDDAIAVFFVLASLYLLVSNKKEASAVMMAVAVVSKLFPLLIVPLFLRRWKVRATAMFAVVVIGFYVPFLFLGGSILAPVEVYVFSSTPIFNAGALAVFQSFFAFLGAQNPVLLARIVEYSIFGGVLAIMLVRILRKPTSDLQLMRYSAILITVYIAFSSTVQPWYLSWVFVPFLVIMPTWSWIIFSGTIFLTYYTFTQQPLALGYWAEITWVKVVEFAQLYLMMAFEIATGRYFVPRTSFRGPSEVISKVADERPSTR